MQDAGFLIQRGQARLVVVQHTFMRRTVGARGHRGSGEGSDEEASFGYTSGPEVAAHMDNPVTSHSDDWEMKM